MAARATVPRTRPGAPTSSIDVDSAGEVGIGTSSPDEELHVRRTDAGPTRIKIENTGANQTGFIIENSSREWSFTNTGAGNFVINDVGDPNELTLTDAGTLTISGSINTTDCSPCVSDYVFEPGYELMPLDELEAFIRREGHLPNVPSQADVDKAGKLDMTRMQMRMLAQCGNHGFHDEREQGHVHAFSLCRVFALLPQRDQCRHIDFIRRGDGYCCARGMDHSRGNRAAECR